LGSSVDLKLTLDPTQQKRCVTSAPTTRRVPLKALTGIRFFAAIHVVLFHYAGGALAGAHWTILAIVACGPSAVSLFYVLSGIVLVYSCTNDEGLSSDRWSFWRARFARIYPTYLLALVIGGPFFLSAMLKAHDGVAVALWGVPIGLLAILLLHAWTPLSVFAWNTPGWSVSAEAFFYSLFPSLSARLKSRSARQLLGRASFFYLLALVPPLIVVAAESWGGSLLQAKVPAGSGGLDLYTWIVRFAGFSPIARLPEFLIGICVGYWLTSTRPTLSSSGATWAEVGAVALLTSAWIAMGLNPHSKTWLDSGLLAPFFVLLLVALALGSGMLAKLLSKRPFQVLGDASYAMYILQEPVLIWWAKVPMMGRLPTSLSVSLYVVTLILVSIACQRYIAEPARIWLLGPQNRGPVTSIASRNGVRLMGGPS
jgi:peptidoglycan/LPS O-acetylase OafA/YrhL